MAFSKDNIASSNLCTIHRLSPNKLLYAGLSGCALVRLLQTNTHQEISSFDPFLAKQTSTLIFRLLMYIAQCHVRVIVWRQFYRLPSCLDRFTDIVHRPCPFDPALQSIPEVVGVPCRVRMIVWCQFYRLPSCLDRFIEIVHRPCPFEPE